MGQICSFCGSSDEPHKSAAFADTSTSDVDVDDQQHPNTQQHPLSSSSFNQQQDPSGSTHDSNGLHQTSASSHAHSSDHLLSPGSEHNHKMEQIDEKERERRLKQYQLEQAELARREGIVVTASQSMVPVGGSQGSVAGVGGGMMNHHHPHHQHHRAGGIYTYYDPAYAAAAAQDILNCAARSGGLVFADDEATRAAWNVNVMGVMPTPASSSCTSKDVVDTLGRGRWDGVRLGSRGSGVAGCGGEDPEYYLDDLAEAFLETMVPTKTTLFGGCPSIVENLP